MESTLDLSRWPDRPRGLWYRRWTIVATGLRQVFRTGFFRTLIFIAGTVGVAMAAAGFLFTQSVASGGWLETLAASLGPRPEVIAKAFTGLVLLYPDICIRGLFTAIFWGQAHVAMFLSLLGLTAVVPRLIARDRASHALTIYLSRPLTSFDYLLGKLGIIVGILLVLWTGPLVAGWIVSMLFVPDTDFVVYSVGPLLRALTFNGIALVALAAIALGASSATRSGRTAVLVWIALWILTQMVAAFPTTPEWLRIFSFTHDLREVRAAVFRLGDILTTAGGELPLFNRDLTQSLERVGEAATPDHLGGALVGLAVLAGACSLVFFRRLRPE